MGNIISKKSLFAVVLIFSVIGCSNPANFAQTSGTSSFGIGSGSVPSQLRPTGSGISTISTSSTGPVTILSSGGIQSAACSIAVGTDLSSVVPQSEEMTDYCNCIRCGFISQVQAGKGTPSGGNLFICSQDGYAGVWSPQSPQCGSVEVTQFPWQTIVTD